MQKKDSKDTPTIAAFDRYVEALKDGEILDLTQEEIGAEFGVCSKTVRNWNLKINWAEIREEYKKRRSRDGTRIDRALARKAASGDVHAIELWKQSVDGWIPESKQHTTHDVDESLVDAELDLLMGRKRDTLDAIAHTNDVNAMDGERREAAEGVTSGKDLASGT